MSTSTKTVAERFQGYANEADQRAVDRLEDDGIDSPMGEWLTTDPRMQVLYADALATLGDRMLRATCGQDRDEAADDFASRVRLWAGDYVNAWSDDQRIAFMAQIDAETAEARRLDLAEGNDD